MTAYKIFMPQAIDIVGVIDWSITMFRKKRYLLHGSQISIIDLPRGINGDLNRYVTNLEYALVLKLYQVCMVIFN